MYDEVEPTNTRIEGVTLANSAFHTVILPGGYHADRPALIRWTKIFTWRANGDGINPFSNGLIEDCFIRTQDDSTYVRGQAIRRVVYWQDSNGSTFVLSPLGGDSLNSHPLVVEDCTVVYARAKVGCYLIRGPRNQKLIHLSGTTGLAGLCST